MLTSQAVLTRSSFLRPQGSIHIKQLLRWIAVGVNRPGVSRTTNGPGQREHNAAELAAARQAVRELQRRLERAGLMSHRRRRRWDDWGTPPDGPVRAFRARSVDQEMAGHLRHAGVTEEEIAAIKLVGIGADELNALVLKGVTAH